MLVRLASIAASTRSGVAGSLVRRTPTASWIAFTIAAAVGTDVGPPLIHSVYEPNHHGDIAFQRAAKFGVRAHHWTFGNMPPVPEVDEAAVEKITAYVRWLQQAAGIQ